MLLEVENLEIAYGDYQVVWGVSLAVAAGESVALLGPNGSGKSTVVNTISGLIPVKAGDIRFEGLSLVDRPTHARAGIGIAHVLERRRVFPHLSVLQNLLLGAWHARAKATRAQTVERVFGLFPRLKERTNQLARTLSGGEQQMLAIGRALLAAPKLMMVDEPSLGLSPRLADEVFAHIRDLNRDAGLSILLVEQNTQRALEIADRAYVLELGQVMREGAAHEVAADRTLLDAYLGQATALPRTNVNQAMN
jgi:branched-chain amino acid transport system ATP-binding protein